MKLKADIPVLAPKGMRPAIESSEFYQRVLNDVLVPFFKVPRDFGPAEFYIQACDFVVGREDLMCEARLTGVTWRADRDFAGAQRELEAIYAETLVPFLARGQKLQLLVAVMTTKDGEHDDLYEGDGAHWFSG